jgi:hypothetical protein
MTRSRGKSVAIAFLLGTFLTGGTLGFAYGRTTGTTTKDNSRASREYNYGGMVRELQRDLSLTDAQTAVVDSILKWRRARYSELMLPIQPALDSARDSARVLIMQRLDDTQRQSFQKLLDDISARSDSSRAASQER